MSQLETNISEIKSQKNTYLIPQNIKKGVTVLGVEGALRNVDRTYVSVQAMEAETDVQAGDTATILKTVLKPVGLNKKINNLYLPETIVCSTPVTTTVNLKNGSTSIGGGGERSCRNNVYRI